MVFRTLAIVLVIGVGSAATAAADNLDALVSWAQSITQQPWQPALLHTVPTAVEDHFGRVPYEAWTSRGKNGLGYPGLALPTAGAGSSFVYDAVHHIAAGTGYNDDGGYDDLIAYATQPPSKIPSRDLSGVVSARGLRLGMSPRQAAMDLGVPLSAVRALNAHYSALSVSKKCPVPQRCFTVVIFRDGRAVYIKMGISGGM